MNNAIPKDQQARDAIINNLDENFFVEAGAGSGKTASLIHRLLNLTLKGGVELSHIAAITFTEAAATELKQRLRVALESVAQNSEFDGPNKTYDYSEYQEQAQKSLEALPGAAIGTLHSFCLGIIRQFPLEAGVPPEVRPVSELMGQSATDPWLSGSERIVNGVVAGDAACIDFVDELVSPGYGEEFREALNLLLESGVQPEAIRDALMWLDSVWGELGPTRGKAIMEPTLGLQAGDLKRAQEELEGVIAACTNPEDKLLTTVLMPNLEQITQVLEAHPYTDSPLPLPLLKNNKRAGSKGNWPGEISVSEARDKNATIVTRLEQIALAPYIRATTVVRRVLVYLVQYQARKRRQAGQLEFHDMLYIADELVQIEHVREDLHKQYTHILVDEFQDTDPIQARIVNAIASEGGDPVPGSLFTVGDPKQSIYRFRRADIATYLAFRPEEDDDKLKKLTTNFRSSPVIIDAINSLFEELFTNHQVTLEGAESIPFTPLTPGKTFDGHALFISHGDDNPAELPQKPNSSGDSPDYEQVENDDIVAAIREVQSGAWSTKDKKLGLGDVVILVPSRNVASRVLKELRSRGIDAKTEKTYGLFQATEIGELVAVLRAVADPADRFAQVAAMRSPLLGCSDEELAAYRMWELEHRGTEESEEELEQSMDKKARFVHNARTSIKTWRREASKLSIGELVKRIIADTKLQQHLASLKWFDALNNVRAFQELAYAYDEEFGGTPREFVSWVDSETAANSEFSEPVLDLGRDAVTIMTIHNSKGRQFPIVIVAGMANGKNNIYGSQLFNRETGVAEIKFSQDIMTSDYEEVLTIEKGEKANEELRQQYVAMTRAEAGLVVPLGMRLKKDGEPHGGCVGAPYLSAAKAVESFPLTTRAEAFPNADATPMGSEAQSGKGTLYFNSNYDKEWFEDTNEAVKVAAGHLPRIAATRIAHADRQDSHSEGLSTAQMSEGTLLRTSLFADSPIESSKIESIGGCPVDSTGPAFGTAVHEVMEALLANDDLDSICDTVASTNQLSDKETNSLKDAVRSLSESEVFKRARNAGQKWAELPILGSAEIDEGRTIAIDGVIDLLYVDADGQYVVADYKTDGSANAEQVASYFGQLYVYSKLLPVRVKWLELVFARQGNAEVRILELK